jgi:hypothetical protein
MMNLDYIPKQITNHKNKITQVQTFLLIYINQNDNLTDRPNLTLQILQLF